MLPDDDPNAIRLMCEGQPIRFTCVKLVDDAGAEVARGQVGHMLISGDNVTRGYFRNPQANAAAITADGWLRTGDLALWHDGGAVRRPAAPRRSSSSTARTTIRTTSKPCCRRSRDWNWARSPRPACATRRVPTDELVLFVLHRSDLAAFVPIAMRAIHLVNEHAGVEVARVVPVSRIPKTTSGKLQRTALAKAFEDGEFAAVVAEFDAAWQAAHVAGRAASRRRGAAAEGDRR